jgi:hypothetical protein
MLVSGVIHGPPLVHGELEAEALGFAHGVRHEIEPRATAVIDRPFGNEFAGVEDQRAAESGALHGFEIERDAIARHVSVHPHPQSARPGGQRWMQKSLVHFPAGLGP